MRDGKYEGQGGAASFALCVPLSRLDPLAFVPIVTLDWRRYGGRKLGLTGAIRRRRCNG